MVGVENHRRVGGGIHHAESGVGDDSCFGSLFIHLQKREDLNALLIPLFHNDLFF